VTHRVPLDVEDPEHDCLPSLVWGHKQGENKDLCCKHALVFQVRKASKACVEAFKSMDAALETARVPAGAAGSERNLQVAPASTILDRLQALQTLTLKVSASGPQVSLLFQRASWPIALVCLPYCRAVIWILPVGEHVPCQERELRRIT